MTTTEMQTALNNGEALAICTFWGARLEVKMMRPKGQKEGERRAVNMIHTTLLTEGDPLQLQEFLPDDVKPETWVAPAKRGERVVARMRLAPGDFGRLQLLGVKVEKLEDVAAPVASVPSAKQKP